MIVSEQFKVDIREKEEALIKKDEQLYITLKLQMQQISNFSKPVCKNGLINNVKNKIFNITNLRNADKTKILWDNTLMMKNMKFCTPPRFLIVEVYICILIG